MIIDVINAVGVVALLLAIALYFYEVIDDD